MEMTDLSSVEAYDSRLKKDLKRLKKSIEQLKEADADAKGGLFESCQRDSDRVKLVLKSFKNEIKAIPEDSRAKFSVKLKKHEEEYKALHKMLKFEGAMTERGELMKGSHGRGEEKTPDTTDGLLRGAAGTAEKTTESLQRTAQMVAQTQEVGNAVATKMVAQTQQIGRVKEKVRAIDENLNRADKLISRFMRRLYTDKVILAFTFLVVMSIAGIIIYSVVKPDQSTFNVPDVAKPNPDQIKADANTVKNEVTNRRLLRGDAAAAAGAAEADAGTSLGGVVATAAASVAGVPPPAAAALAHAVDLGARHLRGALGL